MKIICDKELGKCVKQTVSAVIITKDGEYFTGQNQCKNPQTICPRKGLPSGVGYDMCKKICKQDAHAEVDACKKAGLKARGATLLLFGHTWCCENCRRVMREYGITRVEIMG